MNKLIFVKASQDEASKLMADVFARSLAKALKADRPAFGGTATGKTFEMAYPEVVKNFNKMPALRSLYPNLTIGQMDTYWCKDGDMWSRYGKEIYESLVSHLPGTSFTIPYGKAENPDFEAAEYAAYLEHMHSRTNEFYVQFAGSGENGHIAFNEPGTKWCEPTHLVPLTESTIAVNAKLFENGDTSRIPRYAITTGMLELQKADLVIFGAFGSRKATAVHNGFYEEPNENVPISMLQTMPCVLVCVDKEASAGLPRHWFTSLDDLDVDDLISYALSLRG